MYLKCAEMTEYAQSDLKKKKKSPRRMFLEGD